MKNADTPDHPFAGLCESSHRLLRVMEAVRDAEGDAAIGDPYAEYERRIHVGQDLEFDPQKHSTPSIWTGVSRQRQMTTVGTKRHQRVWRKGFR